MKSEARSPKAERRPSSEIRRPKPDPERGSGFGLLSAFDLRPSDLTSEPSAVSKDQLMRLSYSQQPLVHVGRFRPCCCSNHAKCPRVPRLSRSAIQASSTFLGSPFRHVLRSASLHPIRLCSAATTRSACAVSASWKASPKWLSPGRVSICSSSSYPNSSPPRHQPLPTRLNSPRRFCLRRHSIRSANTFRPAALSFGMPHSPNNRSTLYATTEPTEPTEPTPHPLLAVIRYNSRIPEAPP